MSLLLDALRRAEEARRAKEVGNIAEQAGSTATTAKSAPAIPAPVSPRRELAIEDVVPAAPKKSPLIATNAEAVVATSRGGLALEAMPVQIADPESAPLPISKTRRAPSNLAATAPVENKQREVARNVFAAKQSGIQTASDSGKRKWIIPVVASVLVLVSAGGWYVWNEINRVSRPVLARTASPPAALPPAAVGTGQIGSKPPTAVDVSAAAISEAPLPPLLPAPSIDASLPKTAASFRSQTDRGLTDREALATKLRDAPVAKEAPMGLRLARSVELPRLNPELASAYQALVNGDYSLAQKLYTKVVATEPLNIDAQLGLATAAARSGNSVSAKQYYRQVLALDPRNGLAIMGLVALSDGAQSAGLEIELKTLIGRNPDAAPLHFALGNIYAGDRRWTEAQQAYFDAFRIDSGNPDYLFNLAVSLDQLHQTKLALDYYRKAEGVSLTRGGGQFDRNTVAKRIRELSGESGRSN